MPNLTVGETSPRVSNSLSPVDPIVTSSNCSQTHPCAQLRPTLAMYMDKVNRGRFETRQASFDNMTVELYPPGWPEEDTIEELARRSSGIFIWAATALGLIEEFDPVVDFVGCRAVNHRLEVWIRSMVKS